jgi:hypothetical protein
LKARAIYSRAIKSRSGDLLSSSPPAEKSTACEDQTVKPCTGLRQHVSFRQQRTFGSWRGKKKAAKRRRLSVQSEGKVLDFKGWIWLLWRRRLCGVSSSNLIEFVFAQFFARRFFLARWCRVFWVAHGYLLLLLFIGCYSTGEVEAPYSMAGPTYLCEPFHIPVLQCNALWSAPLMVDSFKRRF